MFILLCILIMVFLFRPKKELWGWNDARKAIEKKAKQAREGAERAARAAREGAERAARAAREGAERAAREARERAEAAARAARALAAAQMACAKIMTKSNEYVSERGAYAKRRHDMKNLKKEKIYDIEINTGFKDNLDQLMSAISKNTELNNQLNGDITHITAIQKNNASLYATLRSNDALLTECKTNYSVTSKDYDITK